MLLPPRTSSRPAPVQLDLFSWAEQQPFSWPGAREELDRLHPDWLRLHLDDLRAIIANRWSQDDIYSVYVDLMAEHKVCRNIHLKANLRRAANGFYLAMTGSTARKTFTEAHKQKVLRTAHLKGR